MTRNHGAAGVAGVAGLALAALLGCHAARQVAPERAPGDADVLVFLQPLAGDAARLRLAFASVALVRADGAEVPLALEAREAGGERAAEQRLLAAGRAAPGAYAGLRVRLARAAVETADGAADLLVDEAPATVEVPFAVGPGEAAVLHLDVGGAGLSFRAVGLAAAFRASVPPLRVARPVGFVASAPLDGLVVFDRVARQVIGVVPTGRGSRGVAFDPLGARTYVAVAEEDRVAVVEEGARERSSTLRLEPGDRPVDVALAAEGRVLAVANAGSDTVAFLDPASSLELGRARVAEGPERLFAARDGRRVYALSRVASTLTVLDVGTRAVAGAVATDPHPLDLALDRAGRRLYLVHAGSPHMDVWELPGLTRIRRVFVGLGATAVEVDPATDLVYVARGGDPRIQVHDPAALVPVHHLDVGGGASELALDETQGVLFALLPGEGRVVAVDLGSRRRAGALEVGGGALRLRLGAGQGRGLR